ncbi:MAG: Asp-tRNA(Asn)/Glu-tRNA(Gln) amidotransferase GatCAB subunit B, partial [Bacilli bacterium]
MELVPTIGVEIHVQLKTQSKMFSKAPNTFGQSPNTQIVPLDLAFPGTMPVVNRQAVS